jgi:hypothetical protein
MKGTIMRRKIVNLLGSACVLAALSTIAPLSPTASAQQTYQYLLSGNYAVQFTGNVFLPAPFNTVNGPFARNGRVNFDGIGNFSAVVVANYNGTVSRDQFSGTYIVNPDNTFTLSINNLPIPAIPAGIPNTFTFDGVLADNGHIAKIILSGVSVGGQPQTNIGSVITGELVKQYHTP